jgi:hypothetical protein
MILNPLDGSIQLNIPDDITAAMNFNGAVYDVDLADAAGISTRVFKGTVMLHREITK